MPSQWRRMAWRAAVRAMARQRARAFQAWVPGWCGLGGWVGVEVDVEVTFGGVVGGVEEAGEAGDGAVAGLPGVEHGFDAGAVAGGEGVERGEVPVEPAAGEEVGVAARHREGPVEGVELGAEVDLRVLHEGGPEPQGPGLAAWPGDGSLQESSLAAERAAALGVDLWTCSTRWRRRR
jgi:hypothetical protein